MNNELKKSIISTIIKNNDVIIKKYKYIGDTENGL